MIDNGVEITGYVVRQICKAEDRGSKVCYVSETF
jgi:hypothetical protein